MKKSLFFMIALLLYLPALAQRSSPHQRIAFSAINQLIPAHGKSEAIQWYCYDASRGGPSAYFASYKQVHLDGGSALQLGNTAAISLQEAFDKEFIEILADGYGFFRFKNNTDFPLNLGMPNGSIIGDVKGDKKWVSEKLLEDLFKKPKAAEPGLHTSSGQDWLWNRRRKIEVYLEEGLIPNDNPSDAELKAADQRYEEKYRIISEPELVASIRQKASELERIEDLHDKERKVFTYLGLIPNENVSLDALKKAEAGYIERNGISWKNAVMDDYDMLVQKQSVLKYEGYIKEGGDELNIAVIQVGEAEFKKTLGNPASEIYLKEIDDRYNRQLKTAQSFSTFLYRCKSSDESEIIRQLEQELGLLAGDRKNRAIIMETIAFYELHLSPILRKDVNDYTSYIEKLKELKQKLGLSSGLTLDEATISTCKRLKDNLEEHITNISSINNYLFYNDKLYVIGSSNDYDIKKVLSIDPRTVTVSPVNSFSYEWGEGCYINKHSPEIYQVQYELVPVGRLHEAIQQNEQFRKTNMVSFDHHLSQADMQSVIRTGQLRHIASRGEYVLGNFQITGRQYDFSNKPRIIETDIPYQSQLKDVSWTLARKANVPTGSGVVGRLTFKIRYVSRNLVTTIRNSINNLYGRMRGNQSLDFAAELKRDLKKHQIDMRAVNVTLADIDIAINSNHMTPDSLALNLPVTPANKCLLGCTYPLHENSFLKALSAQPPSDFLIGLANKNSALTLQSLWTDVYGPIASTLEGGLCQIEATGVTIVRDFTLSQLNQLPGYDVFTIFAHYNHSLQQIELADGMYDRGEFVNNIPASFTGVFDLTVCHSVHLRDALVTSFSNQAFSFRKPVPIIQGMLIYKQVVRNLTKFQINYIDCYVKTIQDLNT